MAKKHAPRRGSLQYWPRKRSKRATARIRSWAQLKDVKLLGFVGYKAGMCHVIAVDNRPKSLSKGEEISVPATIIECPPMKVAAINYYKHAEHGLQLISTKFSKTLDKELSKNISIPKKTNDKEVTDFDDVRLLVYTQPKQTGIGAKKPKFLEVAVGGKKDDKITFANERLGKEISVEEVFSDGNQVDAHAITTGKGFQGPVKRHGVSLRSHKSEKSVRANIRGPWGAPKMWTVPRSGKMGYNQRVDYNKVILRVSNEQKDVTPKSGLPRYGVVKNSFVVVKGSIPGPKKRAITLTHAIRAKKGVPKEAPQIKEIVL